MEDITGPTARSSEDVYPVWSGDPLEEGRDRTCEVKGGVKFMLRAFV